MQWYFVAVCKVPPKRGDVLRWIKSLGKFSSTLKFQWMEDVPVSQFDQFAKSKKPAFILCSDGNAKWIYEQIWRASMDANRKTDTWRVIVIYEPDTFTRHVEALNEATDRMRAQQTADLAESTFRDVIGHDQVDAVIAVNGRVEFKQSRGVVWRLGDTSTRLGGVDFLTTAGVFVATACLMLVMILVILRITLFSP